MVLFFRGRLPDKKENNEHKARNRRQEEMPRGQVTESTDTQKKGRAVERWKNFETQCCMILEELRNARAV